MILMVIVWCTMIPHIKSSNKRKYWEDSKIIGGREAKLGEFNWMVSLQFAEPSYKHYCGGVLLTMDKVLTACHCAAFYKDDKDEDLFPVKDKIMVAGSVSNIINRKDPYQQVRRPTKIFCHPECRSRRRGGFDSDYSIYATDKDFHKSPTVKPCKIVSITKGVAWKYLVDLVKNHRWCAAVGWGYTQVIDGEYFEPSPVLLKIGVELLGFSKCKQFLTSVDEFYRNVQVKSRYQVCGMAPKNADVCQGDSGGGLVCGTHVYGIISWGPACGEINSPSMYSAIDGVWDFMLQTVFNGNDGISLPRLILYLALIILAIQTFLNM